MLLAIRVPVWCRLSNLMFGGSLTLAYLCSEMFRVKYQNPYLRYLVRVRTSLYEIRRGYKCSLPSGTRFCSVTVSRGRFAFFSSMAGHLIDVRDGYKWNIIIKCLQEEQKLLQSIMVFYHVRREALTVDGHTLRLVIKSCADIPWLFGGEAVHGQIFKMGFGSQVIIQTTLLQMYAWSRDFESAKRIFDETLDRDLPLWNAFIKAYGGADKPHRALGLLCDMIGDNLRPNVVTAVCIISACSPLRSPKLGKLLHGFFVKLLVEFDVFVYNALIEMYVKSGCLSIARRVFEQMPAKNVVTWTAMLNGYVENNFPLEAFAIFRKMVAENVKPDEIIVLGLLSTCSKLGRFDVAEMLDCYIRKNGFGDSVKISNAFIDMYSKCGNLERACRIFDSTVKKNLITWTAMIQGLALHGQGVAALVRFAQMQREGFKPDEIAFTSILFACGHAGLVQEARMCFTSMVEEHKLVPWMDQYGCMVDLLCRAGQVNEAFDFVKNMPVEPDEKICRILLSVCNSIGDMDRTKKVQARLLELEPNYSGNCILISNWYASNFEWTKVKEIRDEMRMRMVMKGDSGHSLVEAGRLSNR